VWTLDHLLWIDLALGPAIACFLAAVITGRPARLVRILDARPMRGLGLSSYSLYLTLAPIVVVLYEKVVAGRVGHGGPSFLLGLAVILPATIAFGRGFGPVFEIAFQRHRGWPPALRAALRRRSTGPGRQSAGLPRPYSETAAS
jgi:peptidoglycan/LPS O-acetylase OafA/YrhL